MIDLLTAGENRHSSKKEEREHMKNAKSIDPLRARRREARELNPDVARREDEEEEERGMKGSKGGGSTSQQFNVILSIRNTA